VIVHGVQEWALTGKLPGPLPFGHKVPSTLGYGPDDAQFLARNGFNLMRLSMSYWEYAPGRFDDGYLDGFRTFVNELDTAGVYSLLDLQQAIYGPHFKGGEGFPDWMTFTDGVPSDNAGYPDAYFGDPAENRAWDNFWANVSAPDGVGLQDHLARGWQHLADRFAATPGLLGFDLLNEPWPGSVWQSCAGPLGCPPGGFDGTSLSALYGRIIGAIRQADPTRLVVYEPNLLFDYGAATNVDPPKDPHLVFGFHDYCLGALAPGGSESSGCATEDPQALQNAIAYGQRSGNGLLLGEWGGLSGPVDTARMVALADQYLLPWSYWDYGNVVRDPSRPPTGTNVNSAQLRLLVRPYPQTVAGTPKSIVFDPATRQFTTTFTTTLPDGRPAGALSSDVFIPRLQYPNGYRVTVAGAGILPSTDPQHLELRACPGSRSITVEVAPGGSAQSTSCSFAPFTHGCRSATGKLGGLQLGPVKLGMTRARARSRFSSFSTRGRRFMDFFCPGQHGIRAGYPSPKLLRTLSPAQLRRVQGRVVLALTANRHYGLRRVHPGARLAAVARQLTVGRGFHIGLNWWYLVPNGPSRGVLIVRHGKIEEIGIADKQLTTNRLAVRRFLTSFS